jgi:hypothetical protein
MYIVCLSLTTYIEATDRKQCGSEVTACVNIVDVAVCMSGLLHMSAKLTLSSSSIIVV